MTVWEKTILHTTYGVRHLYQAATIRNRNKSLSELLAPQQQQTSAAARNMAFFFSRFVSVPFMHAVPFMRTV